MLLAAGRRSSVIRTSASSTGSDGSNSGAGKSWSNSVRPKTDQSQ
jgi:hypothetical protein